MASISHYSETVVARIHQTYQSEQYPALCKTWDELQSLTGKLGPLEPTSDAQYVYPTIVKESFLRRGEHGDASLVLGGIIDPESESVHALKRLSWLRHNAHTTATRLALSNTVTRGTRAYTFAVTPLNPAPWDSRVYACSVHLPRPLLDLQEIRTRVWEDVDGADEHYRNRVAEQTSNMRGIIACLGGFALPMPRQRHLYSVEG